MKRISVACRRTGAATIAFCIALLYVLPAGAADERSRLLERIRRQPRQAASFSDLAAWLFRRGDIARGLAAAREAARLEPEDAKNQRLLGYLFAEAGAEGRAEEAFRRAADLDPSSRVALADFHLAQAWAGYQRALRSGKLDPDLYDRVRALGAAGEVAPELKALMRARLAGEEALPAEMVPPVYLGAGANDAIVVDKRTQTLRLYRRRGDDLVLHETFPCTTGQAVGGKWRAGDLRTPNGVYVVTDLLPGEALPDLYGDFALPLSYPNAWDELIGRTGSGIWLHGSDRLSSPFTPRDTKGCVLVRNQDLHFLARAVAPGVTPVLIAEEVPYWPVAQWKSFARRVASRWRDSEVVAIAVVPEYAFVIHRSGGELRQEYLLDGQADGPVIAHDRQVGALTTDDWKEKISRLRPRESVEILDIEVRDSPAPPRILIATSGPTEVRGFRPEFARRLYVDLTGVRFPPAPAVLSGHGSSIEQVRVAATETDPPEARLVIDLLRPMTYAVEVEENRVVVSLLDE